jgi:hypothetical protein
VLVASVVGLPTAAISQQSIAVAVPARAGAVEGTAENSDAFIWRLFTGFVAPVSKSSPSPVVFETWASDKDTFSSNPHWPAAGAPIQFQASALATIKSHGSDLVQDLRPEVVDEECKAPKGAAVGGFPVEGLPSACIAEQVARNYAQFKYIVDNKLNTQAGLKVAYQKSFTVEMPPESIALKGDWIPLPVLGRWVPELGDLPAIRAQYYTTTVGPTEYALVSLHVSSRQNPNWVWGTFEHEKNPGRCDYIGCFDSFGAQTPVVLPNKTKVNSQYGSCLKSSPLIAMMASANVAPVWQHYCLKSTEVDYTAADGTPYALGNSVIEGIVGNGTVAASSCISCHAYASFGQDGKPSPSATAILPFNPTGNPIPGVLANSHTFAFMWGVLLAPP